MDMSAQVRRTVPTRGCAGGLQWKGSHVSPDGEGCHEIQADIGLDARASLTYVVDAFLESEEK